MYELISVMMERSCSILYGNNKIQSIKNSLGYSILLPKEWSVFQKCLYSCDSVTGGICF